MDPPRTADARRLARALNRQQWLLIFEPDRAWLFAATSTEAEALRRARDGHGGRLADEVGNPYPDCLAALENWVEAACKADDWRTRLREFLDTLKPYPRAEEVFTELVNAGASPYVMADDLQRWMDDPRQEGQGARESAAGRVSKFTPERILALAGQLDADAARLDQLRDAARKLAIRGFYTDVPERLRDEAKALRQLLHLFDRRRLSRAAIISSLQDHLEEAIGRPCDGQLADLLEAARHHGHHRPVSTRSLEQLRRRRRRRPATPELEDLIRHRAGPVSLRSLIGLRGDP